MGSHHDIDECARLRRSVRQELMQQLLLHGSLDDLSWIGEPDTVLCSEDGSRFYVRMDDSMPVPGRTIVEITQRLANLTGRIVNLDAGRLGGANCPPAIPVVQMRETEPTALITPSSERSGATTAVVIRMLQRLLRELQEMKAELP